MLIYSDGDELAAEPDDTVLSAMRRAERRIQSVCGGRAMCGTCRIAVAEVWLDRLTPPLPQETRLLRVLRAGAANHRLACQTILDAEHDGLAFTVDPPPTRSLQTTLTETAR